MPKRIYMDNSAFRDILQRFLEESAPESPAQRPAQREETAYFAPLLSWEAPDLKQIKINRYPPPQPRKKTIPLEKTLKIADLKPIDQAHALRLLQLGADEIASEI